MSKLKSVKVLTTCALMVALAAILGIFKIPINQFVEIRFGSFPIAIAGAFFGPVPGMIVGALADVVQFFVKPTGPYFPGFTISSAVAGLLYGLVLHTKTDKVSIPRIIISQTLYTIVVGLLINTFNLCILFGKFADQGPSVYFAYMLTRLPKEAIMYPINTILLFIILKPAYIVKNKLEM
ncbi:MAG: folate family ECF transporter S component [Lachnospiraceae bacterium]|nr:folate family ECF transporter S component [Lachnospiraceae bacterium]